MVALMVLALALTGPEVSTRHVRATDSRILTLIDAGISGSATFRGLVAILNESDVMVYVEPNLTRQTLGGYLVHNIVAQGRFRYLRIAIEIAGSERRLVSLLAHELQHAVEVAQTPEARDPKSLERFPMLPSVRTTSGTSRGSRRATFGTSSTRGAAVSRSCATARMTSDAAESRLVSARMSANAGTLAAPISPSVRATCAPKVGLAWTTSINLGTAGAAVPFIAASTSSTLTPS